VPHTAAGKRMVVADNPTVAVGPTSN